MNNDKNNLEDEENDYFMMTANEKDLEASKKGVSYIEPPRNSSSFMNKR